MFFSGYLYPAKGVKGVKGQFKKLFTTLIIIVEYLNS